MITIAIVMLIHKDQLKNLTVPLKKQTNKETKKKKTIRSTGKHRVKILVKIGILLLLNITHSLPHPHNGSPPIIQEAVTVATEMKHHFHSTLACVVCLCFVILKAAIKLSFSPLFILSAPFLLEKDKIFEKATFFNIPRFQLGNILFEDALDQLRASKNS